MLNLTQLGSQVTGTGTFAMEAGPAGTVQVAGTYMQPNVSLVITYSTGGAIPFAGTVSGTRMAGVLGEPVNSGPNLTLVRQ